MAKIMNTFAVGDNGGVDESRKIIFNLANYS